MNDYYKTAFNAGVNKNWDKYREVYDLLTIEDLIKMNTEWDKILPLQNHANVGVAWEALKKTKGDLNVVELGCYRGLLAKKSIALARGRIKSWVGYDINHRAIEFGNGKNRNPNYLGVKLQDWFWNVDLGEFNTFVSTHTLEHFNWGQVQQVLSRVSGCKYILIEIPITHNNWRGYRGSHVLYASKEDILNHLFDYRKFYEYQKRGNWLVGLVKND
jgi:hypothetical protein